MKKVPFITFFVFLFITSVNSNADEKDSLLNIYQTAITDTNKIIALKNLALLLYQNNPDEAEIYCKECIELSTKTDYKQGIIRCNNILGIINIYKTDYASAIENFNVSMEKAIEINDQISVFRVYNNLGSIYVNLSDYEKAVKYFSLALEIAERLNDTKSMAQSYINIAIIHKDNKDYNKALEYDQKAIELCKEISDDKLLSNVYMNVSNIRFLKGEYDGAIDICLKSLAIKRSNDDTYGMGIAYANLGEYYFALVKNAEQDHQIWESYLDSAVFSYRKALYLAEKLHDDQRKCIVYEGLGKISYWQKDYPKASSYFSEVLKLSEKTGIIESTKNAYEFLANIEEGLGNYKEAIKNFKYYQIFNDSIYSSDKLKSISEMEIKYQTEKKQKEIEILNKEKAIQLFKNRILVIGISLLVVFLLVTISLLRTKLKDNRLLKQKNREIEQAREEILAQANNLEFANQKITYQKEQIEKSHLSITNSINYARYIQTAVMPSDESISNLLVNHFILFKPRDIVSGDFYLVKKVEDNILIVAADCTGHGVPGAFMSMLGIALINDLAQNPAIKNAAQLLELLREQVKLSLQQHGKIGEQHEGMDIAVCFLNTKTLMLNFAGAYNPLWLFRKNKNGGESSFTEFTSNRQPVGVYIKEKPFFDHTIQLQTGDTFYIFSDGYYSQFGGKNGEKLKIKYFRQIIADVNLLPIHKQMQALEEKFQQWKGVEPQIDDILVMGVQV